MEPYPGLTNIIESAWILVDDNIGQWDSMQKGMNKRKIDNLIMIDIHSIDELKILEAKLYYWEGIRVG